MNAIEISEKDQFKYSSKNFWAIEYQISSSHPCFPQLCYIWNYLMLIFSQLLIWWMRENSTISSSFALSDEEMEDENKRRHNTKFLTNSNKLELETQHWSFDHFNWCPGAGKCTAIEDAHQVCFEFCHSIDILWGNKTYLFTAVTRCAEVLFNGRLCKMQHT